MIESIDKIWQYSHYYGDMVSTAVRLHQAKEDYAAMMLLFNAMELIFKSVRENFSQNLGQDLSNLKDNDLLSEAEYSFLGSKENGLREIRNIMTHRNAYQYCFDDADGNALPFSEAGTWTVVYNYSAPIIIRILVDIIDRKD